MRTNYSVHTRIKADDMASPVMRRIANQAKKTSRSFRTLNATAGALRSIGGFARPIERGLMSATRGAVAFAAAYGFTAAAVVKGSSGFANAVEEQGRLSRQLGLSEKALGKLKFIADRQGVESFDQLTDGISDFAEKVADLRIGGGELNAILKESDPAFAQLLKNTTDNEKAFELFLAKLDSLPNVQEKLLLANAVGDGGKGFLRLLDGGVEKFQQLSEEAEKFRYPVTIKDRINAQKFVESQTNLQFAMRGVGDTRGSKVIPVLTPFMERLADWIAANREIIGAKIDEYAGRIGKQLSAIDFDMVAAQAQRFADGAGYVIDQAKSLIQWFGGIEGALKAAFIAWAALKGASLFSLVLTVVVQAAAIVAAIATISAQSKITAAAAAADFDKVGKSFGKTRKLLAAGFVIGSAAAVLSLNERQEAIVAEGAARRIDEGMGRDEAIAEARVDADNRLRQEASDLPVIRQAAQGLTRLMDMVGLPVDPEARTRLGMDESNSLDSQINRIREDASPSPTPSAEAMPPPAPARPIIIQPPSPRVEGKVVIEVEAAAGTGAIVRENKVGMFSGRPRCAVGTTMSEGN